MVLKYISWGVLIYVAYCAFLFVMQRQMIYPRALMGPAPAARENTPGIERIWLETEAGRIETWFMTPPPDRPAGPAPAMIVAHGNAELIDYLPVEFEGVRRLGLGVLLVEYPGYGRSGGSPSQVAITHALVAAYDMLTARADVDREKIVFFGRSLGGGAACALAEKRPSAALALASTFTSVRSMAARRLAPGFLALDPFDNLSVVRKYPGPVLIMHGAMDSVIPFSHGKALYRAAPRGRMIEYPCNHIDCPPSNEIFLRDLAAFLRDAGVLKGPVKQRSRPDAPGGGPRRAPGAMHPGAPFSSNNFSSNNR
ncbi:MAG: alpha/beta hydrolase [Desulfobacterales bacterium]|nr:alpha/beta hydrolase [Desulfobacterales bacterium]